uniref:DNA-directed DNA polymerase n=1 Tax=Panagrellus redivivus TaxID=6233 RepID=A0A7E4WC68_PANRE
MNPAWRNALRVLPTFRGDLASAKVQPSVQLATQVAKQTPQQPAFPPQGLVSNGFEPVVPKKQDVAATSNQPEQHRLKEIELVPPMLHRYLFPNAEDGTDEELKHVVDDLLAQIELPELNEAVHREGLMAHFDVIGKNQFERYEELLLGALAIAPPPQMPSNWAFTAGWTRYNPTTGIAEAVLFPDEAVLFFDTEVCVPESRLACLAVAMSPTAWYSWCGDRLVNDTPVPEITRLEHLIPLEPPNGSQSPKIVIGHNIGFDRARVREQYYPEKTGTAFWDTMSMNISIYGMADHQRLLYEKTDADGTLLFENPWLPEWRTRVSKNGLGDVHAKLCGADTKLKLNKSMQNVFVKEDITVIREHFQALTQYCAEDVQATFEVFAKLYPTYRERFPHPITSVGMIEMGAAYLPITENWRLFYEKCNMEAAERNDLAAAGIAAAGAEIAKQAPELDPWLWGSDWGQTKTAGPKWFGNMFASRLIAQDVYVDRVVPTAADVKLRCRDVPRVLGLCYGPFPLHFKSDYGWGYLVPKQGVTDFEEVLDVKLRRGDVVQFPQKAIYDVVQLNRANNIPEQPVPPTPAATVGIFEFHRLPHPVKPGANVGNPFAKDFLADFDAGVLHATRFPKALADLISTLRVTRFWGNYKDRFNEEITVYFDEEAKNGVIAPAIVPAGTITRRATHKLWLTSTSSKEGVIGSDMKSMVQCQPGWKLVGADVDSQEQWLAALLGDVVHGAGKAGATPFANMLLAGSKADNSDLHSVVAKQVGISRQNAKVLNYARLYGAGKNHAIQFLKQQALSESQATHFSEKLFSTTKGVDWVYYQLADDMVPVFKEFLATECKPEFAYQHIEQDGRLFLPVYAHVDGQVTCLFENYVKQREAKKAVTLQDHIKFLIKLYPNYPNRVPLFKSGFESATFNFLEMKALEDSPSTPILGCRLSQALEALPNGTPHAEAFRAKYKRTVINWVIQSTAVDFLHMLLVCMKWLTEKYDIKARFVLSIHDEIRYMVTEEDQYRCALALTLSNMYVRAAISQKLGINELPKSVAFFSQVDIDTVLRKEVDIPCRSPDGQLVPPGVALDMAAIIEKTGGSLERRPSNNNKN